MEARAPHMGVSVTEDVGVAVADRLPVGEPVPDDVRVRVAVPVDERVGVCDAVGVGVAVPDAVGDGVPVGDHVPLADSDAVLDAVPLGVPLADVDGVRVADGGNAAESDSTPRAPTTGTPSSVRPLGANASPAAVASQLAAAPPPPGPGTADRSTPVRACRLGTSAVTLENSRHSCRAAGLSMPPQLTSAYPATGTPCGVKV